MCLVSGGLQLVCESTQVGPVPVLLAGAGFCALMHRGVRCHQQTGFAHFLGVVASQVESCWGSSSQCFVSPMCATCHGCWLSSIQSAVTSGARCHDRFWLTLCGAMNKTCLLVFFAARALCFADISSRVMPRSARSKTGGTHCCNVRSRTIMTGWF